LAKKFEGKAKTRERSDFQAVFLCLASIQDVHLADVFARNLRCLAKEHSAEIEERGDDRVELRESKFLIGAYHVTNHYYI
jgi:hypothetical protein